MSLLGPLLPRAPAAACPQLAKGDIRAPDRGTGFDPKRRFASVNYCIAKWAIRTLLLS